jgi:toxin ParE1/3/4
MTAQPRLTPLATRDLSEIWDYTAARWGAAQADTYLRRLWHDLQTVAERPRLGRAIPDIRPGCFRFRSGSQVLFYRIADEGVVVVRILHERMDVGRHL